MGKLLSSTQKIHCINAMGASCCAEENPASSKTVGMLDIEEEHTSKVSSDTIIKEAPAEADLQALLAGAWRRTKDDLPLGVLSDTGRMVWDNSFNAKPARITEDGDLKVKMLLDEKLYNGKVTINPTTITWDDGECWSKV